MSSTARLDRTEWFLVQPARATPRFNLLCFPYAGGGATIFHGWSAHLPASVEVHAARLPGRGTRLREPAITDMDVLVDALVGLVESQPARPYGLFGHSMGARIAFELARALVQRGARPPEHVWVSGSRAPQLPRRRAPIHTLPDAEFLAELRCYDGVPAEILGNPELLELHLPVVRSDLALHDTYVHRAGPALPVPLSAFGGTDDPYVHPADLDPWSEHTRAAFDVELFSGGHFFLHGSRAGVLERLSRDLAHIVNEQEQPNVTKPSDAAPKS
jgi:medium-chain acyl-[acyl-carrier-protein] hydrolase